MILSNEEISYRVPKKTDQETNSVILKHGMVNTRSLHHNHDEMQYAVKKVILKVQCPGGIGNCLSSEAKLENSSMRFNMETCGEFIVALSGCNREELRESKRRNFWRIFCERFKDYKKTARLYRLTLKIKIFIQAQCVRGMGSISVVGQKTFTTNLLCWQSKQSSYEPM